MDEATTTFLGKLFIEAMTAVGREILEKEAKSVRHYETQNGHDEMCLIFYLYGIKAPRIKAKFA